MQTTRIFRKLTALLLTVMMVFSLFTTIPLTVSAAEGEPDPAALEEFLSPFSPGGVHYEQGLRASLNGNTVDITTDTGNMITLQRTVLLTIPQWVTVDWKASVKFTLTNDNYSGSNYALLTVRGSGGFVLDKDAELEMINWHNVYGNIVCAIRLESWGRKEINGSVTGSQMSGTLDMDVVWVIRDGAHISGTIKYTGTRTGSTALYSTAKTCEIMAGADITGRVSVNTLILGAALIVSEDATINGELSGYVVVRPEPMPSDPYSIALGTSQGLDLISGAADTRAFWGLKDGKICIAIVASTNNKIDDIVYFPVVDLPPDMEIPTYTVTLDFNGGTSTMQTVYEIPLCSTMPAPTVGIYPPAGKYTDYNWGSVNWVYTMSPRPVKFYFSYVVTQDMTLTANWIVPDEEYLDTYDLYAGNVTCDGQTVTYLYQEPLEITHSYLWKEPLQHDFRAAYASLIPDAISEPYAAYDAGDGLMLVPGDDVSEVDWTDPDAVAEYFFPGITITDKQPSDILRDVSDVGNYMFNSTITGADYRTYKYNIGIDSVTQYTYVDGVLSAVTICRAWNTEYNTSVFSTTGTLGEPQHVHSYTEVVTEPTCTEQGYTRYLCDCGESYNDDYTSALGHSWVFLVGDEPTCEGTGYECYDCSRCDATQMVIIPATGHEWTENVTGPTCENQGFTLHICVHDETHNYIDTYTDPLNHDWDEGIATKEATEYEDGEMTYTCLRCFEARIETIPASGHTHNYIASEVVLPTCTEQGYTTYTCICGEGSYDDDRVAALGHDFSVLIGHLDATATEDGYDLFKCSRCDEDYTDILPATGFSAEFTVSFNVDGVITYVTVYDGEKAAIPDEPEKDGFIFTGWYLEGEAFHFDTPITSDIALIAGWIAADPLGDLADISGLLAALESADSYLSNYRKYTRSSFNALNSAVERGLVLAEAFAAEPMPVESQYEIDAAVMAITNAIRDLRQASLLEQILNSILGFIDGFRARVARTIASCRARINQIVSCTVIFNVDGSVTSQNVYRGRIVPRPADPVKEGFIFDGWRVGSTSGAVFRFSSSVLRNLTLYASWVEDLQQP